MSKLTLVKDADSKSSCCSGDDAPPAQDIREVVKQRYGLAVQAVVRGAKPSVVARPQPAWAEPIQSRAISTRLSKPLDFPRRPWRLRSAVAIPQHWPSFAPGETVLDLGSGGGIDVLLSARRLVQPARPTAWT